MHTVYIVGNPGYTEQLNKELHDNSMFIRGQVNVEVPEKEVQLYWIGSRSKLREFKKAIGADLIWKYRLQFFFDLEKLTEQNEQEEEWSADERALMKKVMLSRA
jgi:hypothetical protein